MNIKVGDVVKFTAYDIGLHGAIGIVRQIDNDGILTVEFPEENNSHLHSCSGLIKSNRGWWCEPDQIERISKKAKSKANHTSNLKEKYINKEFVIIDNAERTVLVTDIDKLYMTVKVVENNYSRQNCVGNFFPYVGDIIKYPLTALPVMYETTK